MENDLKNIYSPTKEMTNESFDASALFDTIQNSTNNQSSVGTQNNGQSSNSRDS